MTHRDDLAAWVKAQLSLDYVVTAPPLAEDKLPGAAVLYQSVRAPDTCGGGLIETYTVVLVARKVGSKLVTKQSDIGTLEGLLLEALLDPADRNDDWAHIQGERTEGGDAHSVWQIEVWRQPGA